MARITVIGEVLLDMLPSGEAYQPVVGGSPLNTAVAARRLGCDVSLMARFSERALGGRIRAYVEGADLDLSASVDVDAPVTLAFVVLSDTGGAEYDFYTAGTADWGWDAGGLARLPDDSVVVHTGSLAAAVAPGAMSLLEAYEVWRHQGGKLLSYDPNIRPGLAGEHTEAVARTEAFVRASHVVKVSDEDLAWLYPGIDPREVCRAWVELGPDLVVVTSGGEAVRALTSTGVEGEVLPPATEVVDTIGAGDTFTAGLLSWLVEHDRAAPAADGPAALTADELRQALTYAATTAALTCERAGAQPPTRDEMRAR